MDLVYFYIDSLCINAKNIDFSFDTKYDWYQKDGVLLHCEKKEQLNIYHEFFPNIANVVALVGENGCGKSRAISFLFDIIRGWTKDNNDSMENKYFILYREDKRYYYDSNFVGGRSKLISDLIGGELPVINTHGAPEKTYCIRYSETFNITDYSRTTSENPTNNSFDITVMNRLMDLDMAQEIRQSDSWRYDLLYEYFTKETGRQLGLFSENSTILHNIILKIKPCKISDDLVYMSINSQRNKERPLLKEVQSKCMEFYTVLEKMQNKGVKEYLLASFIYIYIQCAFHHYLEGLKIAENQDNDDFIKIIDDNILSPIDRWLDNDFNTEKETIKEYLKRGLVNSCLLCKEVDAFATDLEDIIDELIKVPYDENAKAFTIKNQTDDASKVEKIYNQYIDSIGRLGNALSFEMKMSSGERAWLNLAAYLNYAAIQMDACENKTFKNVILLLDEPDAFLHPRWQQEALERILEIANSTFRDKQVQIILSTHSPILLSDLLKSHVLYLKRDEEGQVKTMHRDNETFCENIYGLYKDSFFLNEKRNDDTNVWIRGTLANRVVRGIYNELDEIKESVINKISHTEADIKISELNKLLPKIELIGEELQAKMIKIYWQNLYDCLLMERIEDSPGEKVKVLGQQWKLLSHEEKLAFNAKYVLRDESIL